MIRCVLPFCVDLSRLFDLLSRVKDGINPLVSTFEKYIVERGKERLQTIATSTKVCGVFFNAKKKWKLNNLGIHDYY